MIFNKKITEMKSSLNKFFYLAIYSYLISTTTTKYRHSFIGHLIILSCILINFRINYIILLLNTK